MNEIFVIKEDEIIKEILNSATYGTLALCHDNKPYALPINFVEKSNVIFFHGAKKGKKMDTIKHNAHASFSVVEPYSILPSYFSTDKGNACPATHLYKSVIIEGNIQIVEDYDEKVLALQALMEKLQKEGGYTPLNHEMYQKAIKATALFKLLPKEITAKFKLGQNFNEQRYQRIREHLTQRGTPNDIATLKLINEYRK